MNVILTYDLSGEWTKVKNTMISAGYSITFLSSGKVVNLPETTLFHATKTPEQAIADIQTAANAHRESVNRAIATELNGKDWQALYGIPL